MQEGGNRKGAFSTLLLHLLSC